ncbi:mechanosensitive ion channel family protein [Gemelliphila palaticanis]|uniref:Mechanosensitive ion channel n=1 Tax=Gemelliphila palaticanis TaxID=81950 RepID=A0ABX2SZT8_9BACL|nr:mechanosensitive ion channel domain-containing protein [Gemella palaticanis]MBF0715971.1 mechanosensitive ion channel [Gemella palaticanis]NYS47901.1 mechanosensitive ion channel [Gemella palaticanis]
MYILLEKFKSTFLNNQFYELAIDKISSVLIIIFIGYLVKKILLFIVDYISRTSLKANKKLGLSTNDKRSDTVRKLIKSVVKYSIYFIIFIEILSIFGVNTTGILASAGLVSVAVGFGAQSLVKDIITGFFLILEGQFDVGDYVKINNQSAFIAEGTVITLGLRSTKILSDSGEIFFVPNSSINQVINYSKMYNLAKVEVVMSIEESYNELENNILTTLSKLSNESSYNSLFYKEDKLKVSNIIEITQNSIKVEISVKTKLGQKVIIENMLKKDIYNEFKERLIS